jgi:hypothetical protein
VTTATITRLRSGGAVLEVSGATEFCPDWRWAASEADARGLAWTLAPLCDVPAGSVPGVPASPTGGLASGSAPVGLDASET